MLMQKPGLSSCLAMLTAACTTDSAPPEPAAASSAVRQCIALDQVAGRRVVGSAILFEMSSGPYYRNDFVGSCPGVERLGATATVSLANGGEGGRLCSGDRVRVIDPVEARATGLLNQPTCVLGAFQEVPR